MVKRTGRRTSRVARKTSRKAVRRSSKRSAKSVRRSAKRKSVTQKTLNLPYSYETTDDLPMNKLRMKVKREAKFEKKRSVKKSKKGPSPYNKFVKQMSPVLRKQYPDKKQPEIMKLIAKEWKRSAVNL